MADEQYHNFPAQSTLSSGITNADLSATLVDGSGFSSSGDFQVRIDDEIVTVTARSGNTLTIVRAQDGTAAASHSSGATVTQVLTANGLLRVGSRIHTSDTYANKSAAGTRGRLFLPTDGYQIEREDGTSWSPWGPLFPLTAPIDANYAWINQGGASVETTFGGIYLLAPTGAGGNVRLRKKSAPSTPYTITAGFIPFMPPTTGTFPGVGLTFRESGTSKLITMGWNHENNADSEIIVRAAISKWNSATSFNLNYSSGDGVKYQDILTSMTSTIVWYRIGNDGTDLTFAYSADGRHFVTMFTKAKNDFFSTGPDEVGFHAFSTTSGADTGILLLSWKEA